MSKDHFQLTTARALPDGKLHLIYADGQSFEVDLRPWITSTPALRALKDAALFAKAKVGVGGRSVDWIQDELDLGADNLRNLAIEQAGGIGHERIWNWLHDTGLTLEQAALALGISRITTAGDRLTRIESVCCPANGLPTTRDQTPRLAG